MHSLKVHLTKAGLAGSPVGSIVVDADGSYRSYKHADQLEPMASVSIDGYRPDVLCSVDIQHQPPLVAGFEVKARFADWPQGLAQARAYRSGVHHAYFAAPHSTEPTRLLEDAAREQGVGILLKEQDTWVERLSAPDPRPTPANLNVARLAIQGIPLARRLQLNHPLNYLVVPLLVSDLPGRSAVDVLAQGWKDLASNGTRQHAVQGARLLGLLGPGDQPTARGATVADLLTAVGFDPAQPPPKRTRLADAAPAIAAVCRAVLLEQPAVQLVVQALTSSPQAQMTVADLWGVTRQLDESLALALWLADTTAPPDSPRSLRCNPSTVFKFKQVLWHAGILATKAASSAGKAAELYDPAQDFWALDKHMSGRRI